MNAIRRRFQPEQVRELVLIVLIIGIIIFFGTQIESYFSARTFNRISTSVAVIAVVAVGQTLVVLTRNIDLSVGSIVGFTAYVVGTVLSHNNGIPPWAVILMAVVLGALLGSVNGVIVAYGRVPSIIVTLGTLALYRTILVEISGANSVLTNELPKWLIDLPRLNVVSFGEMDVRLLFFLAFGALAPTRSGAGSTSWPPTRRWPSAGCSSGRTISAWPRRAPPWRRWSGRMNTRRCARTPSAALPICCVPPRCTRPCCCIWTTRSRWARCRAPASAATAG